MSNVFPVNATILQKFEDETKDYSVEHDQVAYQWFTMLTNPLKVEDRKVRGYPASALSEIEAFKHILMLVYITNAE